MIWKIVRTSGKIPGNDPVRQLRSVISHLEIKLASQYEKTLLFGNK